MISEHAPTNSIAKSRSLTASKLLRETPAKPSVSRNSLAVDRKRRAGKSRGTKRQNVHALPHFDKTLAISCEHFEISQAPVSPQHRLRPLQVRVARNNGLPVTFRKTDQRASGGLYALQNFIDLSSKIDSKRCRDLVVTASARVQFFSRVPIEFYQTGFNKGMHVFVGRIFENCSIITGLLFQCSQPVLNFSMFAFV